MTLEFHGPTYNWACHTLWLLDIHSCPPSAPGQLDPGLPRYGFLPPSQWRRGQEIQCNPQSFWPHLVVFDSGGPNTKKCWHEPSKEKKQVIINCRFTMVYHLFPKSLWVPSPAIALWFDIRLSVLTLGGPDCDIKGPKKDTFRVTMELAKSGVLLPSVHFWCPKLSWL